MFFWALDLWIYYLEHWNTWYKEIYGINAKPSFGLEFFSILCEIEDRVKKGEKYSFFQCSDIFFAASMLEAYFVIGCLYYLLCAQAFIFLLFCSAVYGAEQETILELVAIVVTVYFFRFAKRTSFYGCLRWPWRNAEKLYMWNRYSFECNDTTTCSINTNVVSLPRPQNV